MSEELKSCPFCGGTNICTEKGINLNYCDSCSAEANIEHWNTRPIEDALNKRIVEVTNLYLQTKDAFDVATEILLKQDTRIAELEAAQRWIPVSERLPEVGEYALAFDGSEIDVLKYIGLADGWLDRWRDRHGTFWLCSHWMPLPEPPIVYGKVCEE